MAASNNGAALVPRTVDVHAFLAEKNVLQKDTFKLTLRVLLNSYYRKLAPRVTSGVETVEEVAAEEVRPLNKQLQHLKDSGLVIDFSPFENKIEECRLRIIQGLWGVVEVYSEPELEESEDYQLEDTDEYTVACAKCPENTAAYYIGVDFKKRYMPYEKNLGSNIMPKVIPEYGVLVGFNFNEYFGVEFGYEWSKKVTARKVGKPKDRLLNVVIKDDTEDYHELIYKRTGYRLHAILNSPRFINTDTVRINTFIAVGLIWQKIQFKSTLVRTKLTFPARPLKLKPQNLVSNKKAYFIPEVKFGLSSFIGNKISIRPYVSWTNTSKVGHFYNDVPDTDIYAVKPRKSISYGCEICF